MTLRQLRYFLQIAELKSFTRASSVLHIAQPALSRQIQQLEDDLGVKLFNRTDTGVTLTDAGALLHDRALMLVDRFEHVRQEVGAYASQARGSIHVGIPPSMFDLITTPIVLKFGRHFPGVKLSVTEGTSAVLHEAVLTGRIDFAVVSSTESLPTLEGEPLLREQLYLIGPPSERQEVADQAAVDLKTIASLPLMLTSRPNAMRLIIENAMHASGLPSNIVLETSSSRLLTEIVSRGASWTILPYCAIQQLVEAGRVIVAPVPSMEITWTLVHSRERGLSIPGQKFRDLLIEIASAEIAAGRWLGATNLV
jgi:LysR family nitrogen assimilation transcriptional regulator